MKKQNYYSIHKNKKKRKLTQTSQMEALKIVNRVIRNAHILVQKMIELHYERNLIPKYKKGSSDGLLCDKVNETIIDKNGVLDVLKNIDIPRKGHVFAEKWFDEVSRIDPLVLAKTSNRNPFIDSDVAEQIKNYNPKTNESK